MTRMLKPFADESASEGSGDPTIENRTDHISPYGSLDLTRDKARLAQTWALKALVDGTERTLQVDRDLPNRIAPPETPQQAKNPIS